MSNVQEYDGDEFEAEAVKDLVLRALAAQHTCVYSMCLSNGRETGYSLATVNHRKPDWFLMQEQVRQTLDLQLVHAVRLCSLNDFIRVNNLMEDSQ